MWSAQLTLSEERDSPCFCAAYIHRLGGQKVAHRVGRQAPVTTAAFSSGVPPHVSLGWNAVRSTDTPHHGGAPARRADPAASAVWAPQKLDLGRLLGPQVTPGPNGGHGPNWRLLACCGPPDL